MKMDYVHPVCYAIIPRQGLSPDFLPHCLSGRREEIGRYLHAVSLTWRKCQLLGTRQESCRCLALAAYSWKRQTKRETLGFALMV